MNLNDRKILFKGRVGSHLYGTVTEESDEDFVGIFLPNERDFFGLKSTDEVDQSTKSSSISSRNTKDDKDIKYYSLEKFIRLLLQNNPNIVEIMFINQKNISYIHPFIESLFREHYDKFISQCVYNSFSGYAYSQRKKMIVKKERYEGLCEAVKYIECQYNKDDLQNNKFKLSGSMATDLNRIIKYYKGSKNNTESIHKGLPLSTIYNKLKEERDNYGWRVKTDSFEKIGYDVKFGYHLIRLMAEGIELLKTGKLFFPLKNSILQQIDDIRNCKVSYNELLEKYNEMKMVVDSMIKKTNIREKPDENWVDEWLVHSTKRLMGV